MRVLIIRREMGLLILERLQRNVNIHPSIHSCICMFVCMYVCMYVCPHVYTYKRVFGVGLDFLIRVLLGVSSLHILYNAPLLQMLGKRKAPLLLVVDEMDQLLRGRDCDVLYNVGPPPKKKNLHLQSSRSNIKSTPITISLSLLQITTPLLTLCIYLFLNGVEDI